jgi:hypothetical protein
MLVYKLDAAGAKQWRKYYGSTYPDKAFDVIQTSDGGYLMIGYSQNFVHGSPPFERDFLVYRLDSSGNQLWRKNYGGTQKDVGLRAVQTPDGGYAFLGYTYSYTNGSADFLVYKVDPEGAKQWRKNYGGGGEDFGLFIRQTSDGGYILSGTSETYIHVPYTVANTDTRDILVYRLNASGAKLWRKNFGGVNREEGFDIQQTLDGGFVVCGFSETYTHGEEDMIVYRLDAAGNKLWRKNYGGSLEDVASYIVCSSDGGFLLYGHTESYTNGGSDFLVYRLDASGAKLWRKNYGGGSNEKIDPWD